MTPQNDPIAKLNLFLYQAKITGDKNALKSKILHHLGTCNGDNYVLFRHSSLYFFTLNTVALIETTQDQYQGNTYLRFDGERVTRISPEYYLGDEQHHTRDSEDSLTLSWGEDDGNSNNNNNNNGNNNG